MTALQIVCIEGAIDSRKGDAISYCGVLVQATRCTDLPFQVTGHVESNYPSSLRV
jgi:hypothetical protein